MIVQKFAVNQHTVYQVLAWIDAGEIAVPEIQRPFVWDSSQVRDLLDSLYKGYPVGYLIVWQNPNVRLKDGSTSAGKKILIDGQQRVTALMTALRGAQVLDWDYRKRHIAIAFNPMSEVFEVTNPAIQKDVRWIPDISRVFSPGFRILDELNDYCNKNPEADKNQVYAALEKLRGIQNVPIGLIELSHELDIDEVTEIFVRINSKGTKLDQADFAMSKIAVAEKYGGPLLRKAIDYFCHMARHPEFYTQIKESDPEFASSPYFQKMAWLRNDSEDIYDPSYGDMLRVAFTYKFERGKMADLVALLSGRDFETRQYREDVAEKAFATLTEGVLDYMNESNFKRFVMIVKSAGFMTGSMIRSSNDLNASYMVFLKLKEKGLPYPLIEALTGTWLVYSLLTSRYSASIETAFEQDIRGISKDPIGYVRSRVESELTEAFWSVRLPQDLEVTSSANRLYQLFLAAQVKGDKGFLSRHIKVEDLIKIKGDVHHIFPKAYLKNLGYNKNEYNQIANYVVAESEVNLAIGNRPPSVYFAELLEQCRTKRPKYGSIVDLDELYDNLRRHCIPQDVFDGLCEDYDTFLKERRQLMAMKIKDYFYSIYNLEDLEVLAEQKEKGEGTDRLAKRRTPEAEFVVPILEALVELGGSAPASMVLDLVFEKMASKLTPFDLEPLKSSPHEMRWRNTAQWCRLELVEKGLLSAHSKRGIWEITEDGSRYLEQYRTKTERQAQ
ncbi:DUF262 domain-containing protein [Coprothermobacteraceae bacterium]|nr:DUF262 domain-containing protein [Coprothermobacteraceae bacterium]